MQTVLIAVDIVKFGDPRRDDKLQADLRTAMYKLLKEAFAFTQIPWHSCYTEDRGDGALIIAPDDVNPDDVLDPLAHHLTALLRRHNRHASETVRLRLRMAVHHGHYQRDENGITSTAVVHLFRLLEAASFKKAIESSGKDIGVIVADELHASVVRRGGLTDPAAYQALRIACKETRARAWLWLPRT